MTTYALKKGLIASPTILQQNEDVVVLADKADQQHRQAELPTLLDPTGRSGLLRRKGRRLTRKLAEVGEWKQMHFDVDSEASQMPSEFCESSAARLDDLVIVAGGFLCDFNRVTDAVQLLNTSSGEWKTIATLPVSAAKTHQGAAMHRPSANITWLYLVSGQIGPGCTVGTTESWALLIRKRKMLWFRLPDLPEVRYAPTAFVRDGGLHVVGGAGPNRRDPRHNHFVLPLLASGHASSAAGWFELDPGLPDGGTDSCGAALVGNFLYRFGGQHGHPIAVNVLVDNNKQCQNSPEVARTATFRFDGHRWEMAAPMPWPASHIGLSTAAFGDDVVVVSGKEGKVTTNRVALYDAHSDEWTELRPVPGKGQPDFLVYFDPSGTYLHAVKFRWHPTNTELNRDRKSITNLTDGRLIRWRQAYLHLRASIKWEGNLTESPREEGLPLPTTLSIDTRSLHNHFGVEVLGVDLSTRLDAGAAHSSPLTALKEGLRDLLDSHGVLLFRGNSKPLKPSQLVALHSLFDHDVDAPARRYHRGMCRLWRAGLPQINLLANRAVPRERTIEAGALTDDGLPCVQGAVYGMDAFGWHADESARPGSLPVQATVFQAALVSNASQQQTHFASAKVALEKLSRRDRDLAHSAYVRYAHNPKSLDAFLPPLEIAGKKDAWLEPDGTAKLPHLGSQVEALLRECVKLQTCRLHASPLVALHPRTNTPALHLDVKQQLGVVGWNFSQSQLFLNRILKGTDVYKHNWRPNDVLITDNFQVLHTAAPGPAFNDKPRLIQRVCLPGGHIPRPVTPGLLGSSRQDVPEVEFSGTARRGTSSKWFSGKAGR